MIKNILLLISILTSTLLFSQTISADINPVSSTGEAGDFEIVGKIVVTNNSSNEVDFTWVRDQSGFVDGWTSGVCDKNLCYLPQVSTQKFNLTAGETGNMDLHLYPNDISGDGFADITVTDDNDPTNFIVLRYNFSVGGTSSVVDFELGNVKAFPNPADDYFTLSDVPTGLETISMYNILGKEVKNFNAVSGANYNVSDLAAGLYLVNLTNAKGENLNTIKMHKN